MWGKIFKVALYILPYLPRLVNFFIHKFKTKKVIIMGEKDYKGVWTPEQEKKVEQNLKFKNKYLELVDGPIVKAFDNLIVEKMLQKLAPEMQGLVIEAFGMVADEMQEITI